MSKWYEAEASDIDIDCRAKDVSFRVCEDDQGAIYLSLSFEQIMEIALKIKGNTTKRPIKAMGT